MLVPESRTICIFLIFQLLFYRFGYQQKDLMLTVYITTCLYSKYCSTTLYVSRIIIFTPIYIEPNSNSRLIVIYWSPLTWEQVPFLNLLLFVFLWLVLSSTICNRNQEGFIISSSHLPILRLLDSNKDI